MRYRMYDCSIELEDNWEDRTINLLLRPEDNANGLNLVVSRQNKENGHNIKQHAFAAFEQSKSVIKTLTMLSHGKRELTGRPAYSMETTGYANGSYIEQVILFVDAGEKFLSFAVTSTIRLSDEKKAYIKNLFSSIKLEI